jgi:hypothetical protein
MLPSPLRFSKKWTFLVLLHIQPIATSLISLLWQHQESDTSHRRVSYETACLDIAYFILLFSKHFAEQFTKHILQFIQQIRFLIHSRLYPYLPISFALSQIYPFTSVLVSSACRVLWTSELRWVQISRRLASGQLLAITVTTQCYWQRPKPKRLAHRTFGTGVPHYIFTNLRSK